MLYNSTIQPKKKHLICGHYDFQFSKGKCQQCAKVDSFYKRQDKELEKDETLSDLIKEADVVFSQYVRLFNADKNGEVKCYTCDTKKHWKQMQLGHYISRSCLYLRYDLRNCRVQDEICNCHKHGNLAEFGKRLEEERQGITEILYEEKQLVYKPTKEEIRQIINEYQTKLINLKKNLVINKNTP